MGAVLQLECFDRDDPPAAPLLYNAEDLADAHARGMIAGRAQAQEAAQEALRAALSGLAAEVEALQLELRDEAASRARSLAPLLNALLEGVLPAVARARLEADLLAAFVRLADTVAPLRIGIACGPDLSDFVAACAKECDIEVVDLDPTGPAGTVTASLLGGTMTWDEAAVADQLRTLICEIMEKH